MYEDSCALRPSLLVCLKVPVNLQRMVSFIGKNTLLSFDYHICDHVYVKTMELSAYCRFQHFVGKTRTGEISTFPEDAIVFQVQILCRDDTYTDARALLKKHLTV